MPPVSAHDLLRAWEVGEDQHPIDRALTLLSVACPELTWDELAALSVGQRDARLLTLRERIFGPRLNASAECPRCADRLEFAVAVADLREGMESDEGKEPQEDLATNGDLVLRFRLPNSRDLAAVLSCRDSAEARNLLALRCVLRATRDGAPADVDELPAEAIAELARRMAERDPQAEVLLDFRCPMCKHEWRAPFDIVAFFWTEMATQAKRLLREVHTLARAYGWREADILEMSARRRQIYLEMVT